MSSIAWRKVTDREIERLMRNAAAGRRICQRLLRGDPEAISDSAETHLRKMADRKYLETWTYDQARVVLEIRREAVVVERTRYGASIEFMIRRCWQHRQDLDDWQADWITKVYENSPYSIRARHVIRLERCLAKIDRWAA